MATLKQWRAAKAKALAKEGQEMRARALPGLIQNAMVDIAPDAVPLDPLLLVAEYGYKACERGESIPTMKANLSKLYQDANRDAQGFVADHFYVIEKDGLQEVWKRGRNNCWLIPGRDLETSNVDRVIGEIDLATGKVIPIDDKSATDFILRAGVAHYVKSIKGNSPNKVSYTVTYQKDKAVRFTQEMALKWARCLNHTSKTRIRVCDIKEEE